MDMSRCLRQSPWQVRDKPVCAALMEFSPLQCTGKVGDKVGDKVPGLRRGHKSRKSATWFVSRTFMICVRDTSATLSGTCHGLCRKVGVMEFGLHRTSTVAYNGSTVSIHTQQSSSFCSLHSKPIRHVHMCREIKWNWKFGAKLNVSSPGALSPIGGNLREGGWNFPASKVVWPEVKCISIRRTRTVDLG